MTRIVDLSLPLFAEMPVHPEDARVGFISFTRIAIHGCNMHQLLLGTHSGTHLDAPYHFFEEGKTVDQLSLEKCVGPALVLDFSGMAAERDLTVADLEPYEERIQPGCRLLLRTDWYKAFPDPKWPTDFRGVSAELAEWLAAKDIALIGVETSAIHPSDYEPVHKAFLSKEVVIVEGLANLDALEEDEVFFIALPLKLRGLDGTPVRAIAIEGEVSA